MRISRDKDKKMGYGSEFKTLAIKLLGDLIE
jgi:hypothetical protein